MHSTPAVSTGPLSTVSSLHDAAQAANLLFPPDLSKEEQVPWLQFSRVPWMWTWTGLFLNNVDEF